MVIVHQLNPVLLHLGPLQIRWYGLSYLIAFAVIYFLLKRFTKESFLGLTTEQLNAFIFYNLIGLFLGARLFYVLVYNFHYYWAEPLEIIAIWKGGLSFHGGLLGMLIATLCYAKKEAISLLHFTDNLAVAVPIGLFLGRVGNFINGELFGRTTNGKWGIIFPNGGPYARHPSQLYEAFFEGVVLFFVLFCLRKKLSEGRLSALFLILYGIFRFGIEFFREPDPQLGLILFHLSMGQLLCVIMMLAGLGLWIRQKNAIGS